MSSGVAGVPRNRPSSRGPEKSMITPPRSNRRSSTPEAIALAQDLAVVPHVSGHHEGERAHRHRMTAGSAHPIPVAGAQPAEDRHGGLADQRELIDELAERPRGKIGSRHVIVLIEAGKR